MSLIKHNPKISALIHGLKLITSLFLLLLLSSCSKPQYPLISGNKITIPDENGWILVNYWAPWCAPCLEEIPEINHLAADLPAPLVAVVGVYFDATTNLKLKAQIKKYNITFNILDANTIDFPVPLPNMLPANFLISPLGKIHGPLLGPQSYASILKAIDTYKK